jgi:hypothetical protein
MKTSDQLLETLFSGIDSAHDDFYKWCDALDIEFNLAAGTAECCAHDAQDGMQDNVEMRPEENQDYSDEATVRSLYIGLTREACGWTLND